MSAPPEGVVTLPAAQPALRVVPMPADANQNGDIFGGWIMSQVDIAGAVPAMRRARGRVKTVAVNEFVFKQPVSIGDLVSFFATVTRVGSHVDHREGRGLRAAQSRRRRNGEGYGGDAHVRRGRVRRPAARAAPRLRRAAAHRRACDENATAGEPKRLRLSAYSARSAGAVYSQNDCRQGAGDRVSHPPHR